MSAVSIPKGPIQLAGLLFKPESSLFKPSSGKTTGLVVVHPGGGVKEQTASLYAERLSKKGFTTVCYDASHQGESGGEPHFLEDPSQRVSDVWAVVDYLEKLDSVDPDNIAVVGICAGGGYAVAATKVDHRVKAVATVNMVNIGDASRFGWDGKEPAARHVKTLEAVAQDIKAENLGADFSAAPYIPPQLDDKTPYDLRQAADYYLTPRGQHPRAANKMLIRSLPLIFTFDAFHFCDVYLTQPTLLIVGEEAGSRWHTERLDKLLGGAAEKVVVPKGTHMDFYDKKEFFGPAVDKIAEFMKAHVK